MKQARTPMQGFPIRLAIACLLTLNTPVDAATSCAAAEMQSPTFDQYSGWRGVNATATGRFRTEKIDGRWWIITPEGHGFWINGPTGISPHAYDKNGNDEYNAAILRKYGSEQNWLQATSQRMTELGINSNGGWGTPGLFSGKKPFAANTEFYATAPVVTQWRTNAEWPKGAMNKKLRDVFDPGWPAQVAARAAAGTNSAMQSCVNNPWCIGVYTDNELPRGSSINSVGTHLDAYMAQAPGSPGKKALQAYLKNRYRSNLLAFNLTWLKWIWSWDDIQTMDHLQNSLLGLGNNGISDDLLYLQWETAAQKADRIGFEAEVAKRYFSVVYQEVKRIDPRLLILGDREIAIFSHPEIYKAMAPYVDVVSINNYPFSATVRSTLAIGQGVKRQGYLFTDNAYDDMSTVAALTDKPAMVSEFYWRRFRTDAQDGGLIFPPLMPSVLLAVDQAVNFKSYQQRMMANPNVVGSTWFQWVDQPAIGRGSAQTAGAPVSQDKYGAENAAIGVVDKNDQLNQPLADTMRNLNKDMYAIRCGKIAVQPQQPSGEVSVLSPEQVLDPALYGY